MFYWLLKWVFIGPVLKTLFRPRTEGAENVPETGPAKPKPSSAFLGAPPDSRGVRLLTSAPGASAFGLSLAGRF